MTGRDFIACANRLAQGSTEVELLSAVSRAILYGTFRKARALLQIGGYIEGGITWRTMTIGRLTALTIVLLGLPFLSSCSSGEPAKSSDPGAVARSCGNTRQQRARTAIDSASGSSVACRAACDRERSRTYEGAAANLPRAARSGHEGARLGRTERAVRREQVLHRPRKQCCTALLGCAV